MVVNIKKLKENSMIPIKSSEYAAGYDLYAYTSDDIVVKPHETAKIGTGIILEIPNGYFGAIYARSGLATKNGLRPANCVGIIDSDYRGEIIVALHNDTNNTQMVKPMDRIAQIVMMPCVDVEMCIVNEINCTKRGDGGFGSTGR